MKQIFGIFKEAWTEFGEDKAQRLGAALAYYTIFSIAPLLLIAIAIAGLVFGRSEAQDQIVGQLNQVLGPATAKGVTEMLQNAAKPKTGTAATIIGVVTLLMGAAGVFGQLKDALNTIWNVEPKKVKGFMGFIKARFLSMAMVLGVGFLLLVTLVIDAAISVMGDWLGARLPGGETLFHALQLALSFALVTLLFAMIFRYLPDTKVAWHDVWFGAAFTSVLFVIGKFGLGLWLGKGTVGSAYGAAGSLVIVLVWVYWSSQILFFGAEFTQVYARTKGSRIGDTSKKDAMRQGVRVEDRPKDDEARPSANVRPMPAYARVQPVKSGGGAGKIAIGGAAGLFLGALVGGVSALVVVFKGAKKLIAP